MLDPLEGVAADGTIVTGASRSRVGSSYRDVVAAALSDVDVLAVGVKPLVAVNLSAQLSRTFRGRCRGVEISAAAAEDFLGDSAKAYGNRVFLRHYCVPLAGPNRARGLTAFPADARAARGFNGDVGDHVRRWKQALADGVVSPVELGPRVARKILLATAGLVSVHDGTWSTDRTLAAIRWGEIHPEMAVDLATPLGWVEDDPPLASEVVQRMLETAVGDVVSSLEASIGLW